MDGEQIIFDPDEAPLVISAAEGWEILAADYTPPQQEMLAASSVATEGGLSAGSMVGNRTNSATVEYVGEGDDESARHADMRAKLSGLEQKVGKLASEGGVWRRVLKDGSWIDFEVRQFNASGIPTDHKFVFGDAGEITLEALAAPFGRGAEYHAGSFTFDGDPEPLLQFVVGDVPGDAPALARVQVTSPDDLWQVLWGREWRRYSDADTARLFLPASDLEPADGAELTTATIGVSGGVSVVRQAALTPGWRLVASTPTIDPLTHEGVYGLLAWIHMPASNGGEVEVGLEYGVGGLSRRTRNAPLRFPAGHARQGKLMLVSLGELSLRAAGQGDHRWIGQIAARSTVVGDAIDVRAVGLVPLGEGNGSVAVTPALEVPLSTTIRDEFNQSAGNLDGCVLAATGGLAGPSDAGAGANGSEIGTVGWSDPGNVATANDNTFAQVGTLATDAVSQYLKATNFGFELPADATVRGITASVRTTVIGACADESVRAVKGGSVQSGERAKFGSARYWSDGAFVDRQYGTQRDLWGATWTHSDINASGFGVAVAVRGLVTATPRVSRVIVTVYYEDSSGREWATYGFAADFEIESSGHTLQRTAVSDEDLAVGRLATVGDEDGPYFTDVVVGMSLARSVVDVGQQLVQAVVARQISESAFFLGGYRIAGGNDEAVVLKNGDEGIEILDAVRVPPTVGWRSVWLHVDARGMYFLWGATGAQIPMLLLAGHDPSLAPGGDFETGQVGIFDAKTGATAVTRNYDNFAVWIPSQEAVLYSGLKLSMGAEVFEREAPGGGIWEPLVPRRDLMRLDPAGLENRKNRLALVATPTDPDLMAVPVIPSDLTVDVYVTPRYFGVPDPASP